MSSRDPPDDDLADLLADLETTLEDFQREFDPVRRGRPPTPGEILRFTEEYSLPTIIAVLEATVRSLELLRQVLRLLDPARSPREEARTVRDHLGIDLGPAVDDAGEVTLDRLERALSDLRVALDEADLPNDPTARSIIEDARALSADIDGRIGDARRRSGHSWRRGTGGRDRHGRGSGRDVSTTDARRGATESITIPVVDESDETGDRLDGADRGGDAETGDGGTGDSGAGDGDDETVSVDIEAELETIRREVRGDDTTDERPTDEPADEASSGTESDDGGDTEADGSPANSD